MEEKNIKTTLMQRDAEYLSELIIRLLDKLEENRRVDFIAKYINAGIALEELNKTDSESFLDEVADFCDACLDSEFYVEADYDHYYDSYDEDDYTDSEWAKKFAEYFRASAAHAGNGDLRTAYNAFNRLFTCINRAEHDYELLGTESPLQYIDVDMNDIFETFFSVIAGYKEDAHSAYGGMLDIWLDFARYCEVYVFTHITDLNIAVDVVIEKSKKFFDFSEGERLFLLLKRLHEERGFNFDGLAVANALIDTNGNYSLYAAQGYFDLGQWQQAIDTIKKYENTVTEDRIFRALKTILTNAYEKNEQFKEAFAVSHEMFRRYKTFELYKRARNLAEKVTDINSFVDKTDVFLTGGNTSGWNDDELLRRKVLSYEGRREELIEIVPRKLDNYYYGNKYEFVKYTVKSLIYSSVHTPDDDNDNIFPNLSEFLNGIRRQNIGGIADMIAVETDPEKQLRYLTEAAEILKMMSQYHIDAADRKRYAKAAYYLGIAVDVYDIIGKTDEGSELIRRLLDENKRRRAFLDEMKKKKLQ